MVMNTAAAGDVIATTSILVTFKLTSYQRLESLSTVSLPLTPPGSCKGDNTNTNDAEVIQERSPTSCHRNLNVNMPHLEELFPHMLALLLGFVQGSLVVEGRGLVCPL